MTFSSHYERALWNFGTAHATRLEVKCAIELHETSVTCVNGDTLVSGILTPYYT